MDSQQNLVAALTADADVQLAVLFGSAARHATRRRSDLDIGVTGVAPHRLSALAVTLARIARREVDLIALDTAPPLLRFEIARDGGVVGVSAAGPSVHRGGDGTPEAGHGPA